MLKPQLEHNREEFDELTRKKWRAFLRTLGGLLPVMALAGVFPDAALFLGVLGLVAVSVVVLSYEYKKTVVFRRDLREQRRGPGQTPSG